VIVITAAITEILVIIGNMVELIIYREIFGNTIAYVQAHRNIPYLEFLRFGRGSGLHLLHFRRISQSSSFESSCPLSREWA